MSAGNASNTVFTAIPVGEDFRMSFSTERFFHNIAIVDITDVVFKLYDARTIGSVGNPNPTALIQTITKSDTPNSFSITNTAINVTVASDTLDAWEVTKTAGVTTVFRGELYGYAEVTVAGEETGKITRLEAAGPKVKLKVSTPYLEDLYWDGEFNKVDVTTIACKLNTVADLTKL
jgi:hypothetical protein